MKKSLLLLLIILIVIVAACQLHRWEQQRKQQIVAPVAVDHAGLAYPQSYSAQPEQIIVHTGHVISYNKHWKIANWASYELTADETAGDVGRHSSFSSDPQVTAGSATDADYRKSGYDRGHLVPAADMKWSSSAMKESFYLSNICPQVGGLNRGRWKELENDVRRWAVADSALIVICGPIVGDSPSRIGSNNVVVPDGFYKVVLSPYVDPPQAIGFIFANRATTDPLRAHVVSVDSVETVTQLDFFAVLPDDIEALLEAHVDTVYWGL